jgi:biotin/methionine sulfoxide reductase
LTIEIRDRPKKAINAEFAGERSSMKKMTQTASHWGVFNVETANGEILGTTLFSRDTRPASYVGSLPETVRHELRIERLHVRESYLRHREKAPRNRGSEAFVPVSWEVALDLIEDELRRVKDRYGNEAIYGGSYGWASAGRLHHSPSVLKRFLGLRGGYVDKAGNHSFGAARHIMPYVIGDGDIPSQSVPFAEMIEHTKLFIMFGGTALKNTQIDSGGTVLHTVEACFAAAKARGIRFVNISPSRTWRHSRPDCTRLDRRAPRRRQSDGVRRSRLYRAVKHLERLSGLWRTETLIYGVTHA